MRVFTHHCICFSVAWRHATGLPHSLRTQTRAEEKLFLRGVSLAEAGWVFGNEMSCLRSAVYVEGSINNVQDRDKGPASK